MDQAPPSASHLEWETHKTHNRVCGTQGPRLRWISIHLGKQNEKCQFFNGLSVQMKRAMVCETSGHETKITGIWADWPALPGRHTSNCVVTEPGVWDKWLRRWWWRWEVKNAQGEGRTRELIYRNGPDSEWYKRQKWNYSPPLLSAYADTF